MIQLLKHIIICAISSFQETYLFTQKVYLQIKVNITLGSLSEIYHRLKYCLL